MRVLVLNAGSSSLKWQLFDGEELVRAENIQRWDPTTGFIEVVAAVDDFGGVDVVGHRVVHGGPELTSATLVDDAVLEYLATTVDLAPLHQPPAIAGIKAARDAFPQARQVACFDTSFHSAMAPAAYTYALPAQWNSNWKLRRYGFHGLSHAYAFAAGAGLTNVDPNSRILTAHLGAGASLCAVSSGRSIDTTMGFTPLEGLVMATRSGNVDPGLVLWLLRNTDLSVDEVFSGLERSSGLAGLSGTSGDIRDVAKAMATGDDSARLAWAVFNHRLAGLAGQMITSMGGVDLIVFTGGVGEHKELVRSGLGDALNFLGVSIDERLNTAVDGDAVITGANSSVQVAVVVAREDLQIVREVHELLDSNTPG